MIVRSQSCHDSIPFDRIVRTKIDQKGGGCWLVTATVDDDRPVVLGRYPTEAEAITADTAMWIADSAFYEFPISSVVAPEERIDDRQSKRHGGS